MNGSSAYTGALTDEHQRIIDAQREMWMRIGLSTDRCDRPAAEAAVRAAYTAAGITPPEYIVWMDSPLGGVYAAAVLRDGQLGGQLWGQLGGQLGGQLWGQLGGQLGGQLWGQLWGQVWDQVYCALSAWDQAYWLAFYSAALPIAAMADEPRLTAMAAAMAEVGAWWWPRSNVVVLTDRPTVLARDNQGRLHSAAGPALAYADGYALYFWHGTAVPEDLITPGWDAPRALRETNTEIRRCAVERTAAADGWGRIVADLGCPQVGREQDDPGNPGQTLRLYRLDDIYEQPVHLLLMTNGTVERDGTRHEFGETVPLSCRTPVAAAAWQIGITATQYRQTVRRT